MNDVRTPDPVVALRQAMEQLRLARAQHESDSRLSECSREVQLHLEEVIRQTRPRSVRTTLRH